MNKDDKTARDQEIGYVTIYGDGIHDDTKELQAVTNGEAKGIMPDGTPFTGKGCHVLITRPIQVQYKC